MSSPIWKDPNQELYDIEGYRKVRKNANINDAREILNKSARESATAMEGGDSMDDSTKMFIERLERDSREREARYHKDASEREARFTALVKEIKADNKQDMTTLREDIKEDLGSIRTDMRDLKNDFKEVRAEMKGDFNRLQDEFGKLKESTDGTNKWIIGLALTTIIAIIAIAAAVWLK